MNSWLIVSISTVASPDLRTRSSSVGASCTRLYSYWKPEQPPPDTAIRSTVPAGCFARIRPILPAARSVKTMPLDAREVAVILRPSLRRADPADAQIANVRTPAGNEKAHVLEQ